MKKVTQSDSDTKNYDEYENFENDYETQSNHRESSNGKQNNNDRSNTYGKNFNPRINQHYDPQTGGNYNDPRANDRRDSNPYQFSNNDNNNFNTRNNFYGRRNHNDGHRNDSSDSNHQKEKDRACILQCFFEELKMVWSFFYSISDHSQMS